jgi:predicted polyphosphate/ATP-dependent NAD kinase
LFTLIFYDKSCVLSVREESDARIIHLFIGDEKTHSYANVDGKSHDWRAGFNPLNRSLKSLGFIVNPIAGMGGAVGLKGTDGREILKKALLAGAQPVAPIRAELFLRELEPVKAGIRLVTGAGNMGEAEAEKVGWTPEVLGKASEATTPQDTKEAAAKMKALGIDLLVFCGGDGTTRNVLDVVGTSIPVLGVPTGVKMYSAVFAVDARAAASMVRRFLRGALPLREAEVMDVDEEAFRLGRVSAKLYGYVVTPYEPFLIQGSKVASVMTDEELRNQAALAIYFIEEMKPEVVYVVGPGTTTRTIGDLLEEKKTLLGVDLFCNKKIIVKDVTETQILEVIRGKAAKIVVTPIGGQGFIFGRGNQQISSKVIRLVGRENIVVIATKHKLRGLKGLRVDTGDPELDDELRGHLKVVTDYREEHVVRVR